MPAPEMLVVSQLTVTYRRGRDQPPASVAPALRDVSLTVPHGAVCVVLGEDGAGKTTLAKVLAGAIPAGRYAGQMWLDGQPYAPRSLTDAVRRGVAVVPRPVSLFSHMSVAENVMIASWRRGRGVVTRRRRLEDLAAETLAHWGVEIDLAAQVDALTPLQQRQLMIVRALGAAPRLLILDEPLAAITGEHAASRLLYTVHRIAAEGITCLYLARRPVEASRIATQVTVLCDGAVAGVWADPPFDERALQAAMASQRAADQWADTRPDWNVPGRDDFGGNGGQLGGWRAALERWVRPSG